VLGKVGLISGDDLILPDTRICVSGQAVPARRRAAKPAPFPEEYSAPAMS
jgi:hypothetical protein